MKSQAKGEKRPGRRSIPQPPRRIKKGVPTDHEKQSSARNDGIDSRACSAGRLFDLGSVTSYIGSDSNTKCPGAAILADTSSLPAFDPAKGTDPSSVIYNVALTNVVSRCNFTKHENSADARIRINFHATRPPGGGDATYRVPYFVAVSTGADVLQKKIYYLEVYFPAGASSVDGQEVVDSTEVTAPLDKQIYAYQMLVGFQLTKAQLDYNEKMGRYAP